MKRRFNNFTKIYFLFDSHGKSATIFICASTKFRANGKFQRLQRIELTVDCVLIVESKIIVCVFCCCNVLTHFTIEKEKKSVRVQVLIASSDAESTRTASTNEREQK